MNNQKAMLIMGAARSGKSHRAYIEAEKRGGYFIATTWDGIKSRFGLAILDCNPAMVIVDGLPPAMKLASDFAFLKKLVSESELLIDIQHRNPRLVAAPMFIFTMLTPPAPDPSLFGSVWSRFEVVTL